MLEKNKELVVIVETLGCNGEGISKLDKYVLLIPFALIGEKVRIKVLKIKQNLVFTKVLEILTPADERVRPKCKVFMKCGGCQLQHMRYNSQLKLKSKNVSDCFYKIAGINLEAQTTVKSDFTYRYRNKLQLPIGVDKLGDTVIGFYAEGSHRIVPTDSCSIHPEWATDLIQIIYTYIGKTGVFGYNEVNKTGYLRQILVREIGGKFIICLVVREDYLPEKEMLINLIAEKFKVFNLYINVNKKDTNVILSENFRCLFGEEKFSDDELGISFKAGPETFMQVNGSVRRKLYDRVLKLSLGSSAVIDAYSGGGLLTAILAKHIEKVYGIESVKESVECADELAVKNNLTARMTNICGTVENELKAVMDKLDAENLTVVLDPPRKGCDIAVINTILKKMPKKIIYISCNPSTLARDIGIFVGSLKIDDEKLVKNSDFSIENSNYGIELIQPYDMFPQTKHVETVVLITRIDK